MMVAVVSLGRDMGFLLRMGRGEPAEGRLQHAAGLAIHPLADGLAQARAL